MNILTQLSAAETYLVKDHSYASYKFLLKYTLIDLLLRKILKSGDAEDPSGPNDAVSISKYVSVGSNFKDYEPKPHELVYLKPFLKNEELQMLFRHVVQVGYENARSRKRFIFGKFIAQPNLAANFKQGFFNRAFGNIKLTKEGNANRDSIISSLDQLSELLPDLIKNKPQEALKVLKKINGNVFLLNNIDFEALKQIDDELTREMSKQSTDSSAGCTGCFIYFDSYSESFDGEYDAVDSSSSGWGGDSGCSTDSGCSGCGGCGGCS